MILELGFDLGKRVELWGFEPQTSCMPCSGKRVSDDQDVGGFSWVGAVAAVWAVRSHRIRSGES